MVKTLIQNIFVDCIARTKIGGNNVPDDSRFGPRKRIISLKPPPLNEIFIFTLC